MTPGHRQSGEHVRKRVDARLATLRVKPKPVTREWLWIRYWADGISCVDIGAELGKDPKTILAWMRHYAIPTRPRGGLTSGHGFKAGTPSAFAGQRHTATTREKIRATRLADGHVPYLKGGQHWLRTVPRSAHPNWKGGITPERQALYVSPEWRAASVAVYARERNRCQRCGCARSADRQMHVHHIRSFAVRELRAAPTNLALLCKPYHLWVHSRANGARAVLGDD